MAIVVTLFVMISDEMDQVFYPYSLKSNPIPSHWEYNKKLTRAIELFVHRLRWHAFHSGLAPPNPNQTTPDAADEPAKKIYGFKSEACPPVIPELAEFEKALYSLPRRIEFGNKTNEFQQRLEEDLLKLKETNELVVEADKTRNFYKMSANEYRKLLHENVKKDYKKSTEDAVLGVNKEAAEIAYKLGLHHRMEKFKTNPAFITLKDHKDGFPGKISVRLVLLTLQKQRLVKLPRRSWMTSDAKNLCQIASQTVEKYPGGP